VRKGHVKLKAYSLCRSSVYCSQESKAVHSLTPISCILQCVQQLWSGFEIWSFLEIFKIIFGLVLFGNFGNFDFRRGFGRTIFWKSPKMTKLNSRIKTIERTVAQAELLIQQSNAQVCLILWGVSRNAVVNTAKAGTHADWILDSLPGVAAVTRLLTIWFRSVVLEFQSMLEVAECCKNLNL